MSNRMSRTDLPSGTLLHFVVGANPNVCDQRDRLTAWATPRASAHVNHEMHSQRRSRNLAHRAPPRGALPTRLNDSGPCSPVSKSMECATVWSLWAKRCGTQFDGLVESSRWQ